MLCIAPFSTDSWLDSLYQPPNIAGTGRIQGEEISVLTPPRAPNEPSKQVLLTRTGRAFLFRFMLALLSFVDKHSQWASPHLRAASSRPRTEAIYDWRGS